MGRHHRPGEPLRGTTADDSNTQLPTGVPGQFDALHDALGGDRPAAESPIAPSAPLTPADRALAASERVAEDDICVLADDLLLDSLARITRGAELGGLLAGWQHEVAAPPAETPNVELAARRLRRAQAHPVRAVIGVAAAVITVLAGGAIVGSRLATPGDPLWPVATMLWSDRVNSADASHVVREALDEASTALSAGDAPSAVSALTRASGDLVNVQPVDGRDNLKHDYDSLVVQASSSMSALAVTTPSGGSPYVDSDETAGPLDATKVGTLVTAIAGSRPGSPVVVGTLPKGPSSSPLRTTAKNAPGATATTRAGHPAGGSSSTSRPGSSQPLSTSIATPPPWVDPVTTGSAPTDPTPTTSADPTSSDPTSTDSTPTSSSDPTTSSSPSTSDSTPTTSVTSQPSSTPDTGDESTDPTSTDDPTTATAPGGGNDGAEQHAEGQLDGSSQSTDAPTDAPTD